MSDDNDDVGYGRPPRHSRFQKGVCPNPKGRGRRSEHPSVRRIEATLSAKITYRENGEVKKATRADLSVRRLVTSALNGNVDDAMQLLRLHKHGKRNDVGPLTIRVTGGLPDDFVGKKYLVRARR